MSVSKTMNLAQALDSYERDRQARGRLGDEVDVVAVGLLREYLLDYCELGEVAALSLKDLEQFFVRWYLQRGDADPALAEELISAVEAWLRWLDARTAGALAPAFTPIADRLQVDLPRVLEARDRMSAHAHREDVGGVIPLGDAAASLSFLSSGVTRVIRPTEVDYGRAEEAHFRITAIEGDRASVQTPAGEHLGEAPLSPVLLPSGVGALLRIGDFLHLEMAPSEDVWEILDVSGVFPGGYDGDTP